MCNCRFNCVFLAVIASLVLGAIATLLTITAAITVTPAFLWVLLGIAIVYLGITYFASAVSEPGRKCRCFCSALNAILVGILGTIVTAVILLGVSFAATSIIGALIVGALIFFFFLIITATACFIRCAFGCNRDID